MLSKLSVRSLQTAAADIQTGQDAHWAGFTEARSCRCETIYFLQGELDAEQRSRLEDLVCDRLVESASWQDGFLAGESVEILLRTGVTDSPAEDLLRVAERLSIRLEAVTVGRRYHFPGLSAERLERLTQAVLANPVIHRYSLTSVSDWKSLESPPPAPASSLLLLGLNDEEMLALSQERRAALDLAEMRSMQNHFQSLGREPSEAEFETIAQTWSEHCVHKTFKAKIEYAGETIDSLLDTYLRAATRSINAPWVVSAFVDNAGIVAFDDDFEVSIKVETHNHPSAIEPFGGANTGVGGVIRDVLGVSARPIAATDVLCFGPLETPGTPPGVLPPRTIYEGVIAGIEDYGNKLGVPIVNGSVFFHPDYCFNPLVYCGCVGIAPKGSHPHRIAGGDRVYCLGGRTGRDGLRGATFSSMTMDAQTGEVAGASVQIGNPIVEKGLIEVILAARDLRAYSAITDCGAGGLSSAVGEMAQSAGGVTIDLARVRLKYPHLSPWEIWLSEAQERMVLAVPPEHEEQVQSLCERFEVEWQCLGEFNDSGQLAVDFESQAVIRLSLAFLDKGLPQRRLIAEKPHASVPAAVLQQDPRRRLLALLADPNIASKESIVRRFDHEVLGQSVVRPFCGPHHDGPSDGAVLKPFGSVGTRALVLSHGLNPLLGLRDPYAMALNAIDEAVRNAVCCGADPARIALLDNFCWGDPRRPETLGSLVEACRGCHDGALHYQAPFVSGKDSLNNEFVGTDGKRRAIPPTLLITALAFLDDVAFAITPDLKSAGNALYQVGSLAPLSELPDPQLYVSLHQAIQHGWVASCHDASEGGLLVAAAEMAMAGRLGLELDHLEPKDLFTESNGVLLAEVPSGHEATFESHFAGHFVRNLGRVRATDLRIPSYEWSLAELLAAWQGKLP